MVRKKVVLVKVTAIKPKIDDKDAVVAPVMVVETPFNEEVPIDENDPQDDKFNPEVKKNRIKIFLILHFLFCPFTFCKC